MNIIIRFQYLLHRKLFYNLHIYRVWLLTFCMVILLPTNLQASMSDTKTMMNLVPLEQVDRTVIKSGRWSSPDTWSGGELPQAGENLYVPANKTLRVDVVDRTTSIGTLRVDGTIQFNHWINASIKVDTLIVTAKGKFLVGNEARPLQPWRTAEIIIADNGPIDRQWDTENMSRGVILHGKTRIFGMKKTAYHPLATFPTAGERQIQLAEDPVGWRKGDIISITATKYRKNSGTYDETRRIASITGRKITLKGINRSDLSGALDYDHTPLDESMPVYAANLTRNVIFRGEGGDDIPVKQRGHFMVIHNPDVIIKGAGFYHLGRTDKSIPLDDFILNDRGDRIQDTEGNYIPGPNNNPRGRYAMHFHHTGVTDSKAQPAICSGNAVISSPGWGFVIHGSHVIMEDNASLDVFGSHFVTEDGNELGIIRHNIAIRAEGGDRHIKTGRGNHDLGHGGHGFWFEGRNLQVEDNVASGASRAGLAYFHRNWEKISGANLNIDKDALLTPHKEIVKGRATIFYEDVPIVHQKHMTVLASGSLLTVIKSNGDQKHDVRNIFESLEGYAVIEGISLEYTEKYLFKDLVVIAEPSNSRWRKGISLFTRVKDVAFMRARIDGFVHPFITYKSIGIAFADVWVNGEPLDPTADIHNPDSIPNITSNYAPATHRILDIEDLTSEKPEFDFSPNMSFELPETLQWNTGFMVTGTKMDSVGETSYSSFWKGSKMLRPILEKGHYTRADGSKYIVLTDLVADRLTGKVTPIQVEADIVHDYQLNLGPNLGVE